MWCVTIQKDHSYGVILFKSRSISSNLVFACEFGLETQTIVQAMLLLIKKAEWNQVSRILGSREEYFENRSKCLTDSNRSVWTSIYNQCRHSNNSWERGRRDKREKHRKRYFQLPWEERERKRGVLGLELGGAPHTWSLHANIGTKPSSRDPFHKTEQSSSCSARLPFTARVRIAQLPSSVSSVRTFQAFSYSMSEDSTMPSSTSSVRTFWGFISYITWLCRESDPNGDRDYYN